MNQIRKRHPGATPRRLLRPLTSLVLAATLAGAAAVQAEPQQGPAGTPQEMSPAQREQVQTFMQTRQELMQVQEQLQAIQEKAVQSRPELKKKQADFASLVEDEMKSRGHEPKQELAEIQALQNKLQSGDAAGNERQALLQQLQEKAGRFQEAQHEALQNEKVRSARQDLMKDIITAMKEENPKTDDLIQQMQSKQQKLEQIHQQVTGQ